MEGLASFTWGIEVADRSQFPRTTRLLVSTIAASLTRVTPNLPVGLVGPANTSLRYSPTDSAGVVPPHSATPVPQGGALKREL